MSLIRSVYAWLLLSLIMLPLFPVAFLVERLTGWRDPRRDHLRRFTASWISLYGWLTPLYRLRVEVRERMPRDGPYVLVANHESGLDVLALLPLRTPARFLAESWLFRIPLAGWLFRACRHIPVRIGDRESGRRALERAEGALAEGSPVAIFPEGRLSPDGLAPFRAGAFVLARRAQVPLVPVLLEGTGRAWRPGTLVVQGRHAIRIAILEPIPVRDVEAEEPEALAQRVRERLQGARQQRI